MKPYLNPGSVVLFSSLLCGGAVFAGGLSTPGQGARAIAMASAFTAVADDASAVFYNPAGISQMDGSSMEGGIASISPELRYIMPTDVSETSTKGALAPSVFFSHRFTGRLNAGLGLYAPYARNAELSDDLANGFASLRSKIVRTDLSGVVSWQTNNTLSIGGGLVIGRSQIDRSIPAGPGLRINDKMDGRGFGAIVGLLWKAGDHLKAGVTYRTEMLIDHDGNRTVVTGGVPTTSNAKAKVRYPASLALGLSLTAVENLTLALDMNWIGWSSMDKVTVRTNTAPDSVTALNANDTWDIRLGAEFNLPQGWAMRAGYAYAQGAFPATNIIPAQPDADGYDLSLGAGKTIENWRMDFAYLYSVTHEVTTSSNVFFYNGKYNISQHLLGLTAAYTF